MLAKPQVLTPGELSTGDPAVAGATTAVSTLCPFSLTLAAPVVAQQSPVAVNMEGDTEFWPMQVHSKICIEFSRSPLSLTLIR